MKEPHELRESVPIRPRVMRRFPRKEGATQDYSAFFRGGFWQIPRIVRACRRGALTEMSGMTLTHVAGKGFAAVQGRAARLVRMTGTS